MTKASTLQAALSGGSGKERAAASPSTPPQDEISSETRRHRPTTARTPSRADKVNVSGWFDPAYKRSMRMVQAITDKKLEALLAEAMNDLFAKYDVPQVRED